MILFVVVVEASDVECDRLSKNEVEGGMMAVVLVDVYYY